MEGKESEKARIIRRILDLIDDWAETTYNQTITPLECCGQDVIEELKQKISVYWIKEQEK